MALTDANRYSELHALDLHFRVSKPEGVFALASLIKKILQSNCFFGGAFPEDSRLCVARCLQQYEKLTEKSRPTDKDLKHYCSFLHETTWSCHRPTNFSLVQGHAVWTRAYSRLTKCRERPLRQHLLNVYPIEDILKTADWSSDTILRRFYYTQRQYFSP